MPPVVLSFACSIEILALLVMTRLAHLSASLYFLLSFLDSLAADLARAARVLVLEPHLQRARTLSSRRPGSEHLILAARHQRHWANGNECVLLCSFVSVWCA